MRAAVTVALSAMLLAGCGGSSSKSPTQTPATSTGASTAPATTSTTLTHAQFVAKLDDICKRGNAVSGQYQNEYTTAVAANDLAKAANAREQSHKAQEPFVAEIAELAPPAADEAAFTRYKTALNRLRGIDERVIAALRARDSAQLATLAELASRERQARTQAATDLGTQNCGM